MAGPSSTVLGALDGTDVVATVVVGHDGHRGWAYYLAVDPSRRRSGLGRRMVGAAERWARGAGVAKIQLMVRSDNRGVVRFYEDLGYERAEVVVIARWLDDGRGANEEPE